MCPAPCSWRTRMWRIDESISGSYTGRIAPPGRPNMTSTPSISRLLMRAWAPVSFMISSSAGFDRTAAGTKNPSPAGEGRKSARARSGGRALHNYENGGRERHRRHTITLSDFPRKAISALVNRARVRRAAGDPAPLERSAVARARHIEISGHVAGVRSAAPTEHAQRVRIARCSTAPLVGVDRRPRRERDRSPARHSASSIEQVAETGDTRLIHQHRLHRRGTRPERVVELARA